MAAPLDEYHLDPRAVRRGFDRASSTYSKAAGVQAELRNRLLERLDVVKIQPDRVLDLGAATGQSSRALKERYPKAQVIAVDLSERMLREAQSEQRLLRRFSRIAMDAHALALQDASVDLAFSNLMLAWCNHPDQVFGETARVLRPAGLFMFTSLGPDTLREVRESFRLVDTRTHIHRFIDMHDLGDALMRTGFAEPVMDTERLTITFGSADALFRELKTTGATNTTHGRSHSLRGRKTLQAVLEHLESRSTAAGIAVTLEVVYGHAWRAQPKPPRTSEFFVPLHSLKRRQ
jgi:malonyl-CoA O-methyltransferase